MEKNTGWANANYDRVSVALPRGKKAEIESAAAREGKSVNAWTGEAIQAKLIRNDSITIQLGAEDPTPQAIESAARRAGMSVNDWIVDVIREAL